MASDRTSRRANWKPSLADPTRRPVSNGKEFDDALVAAERLLEAATEERRHAQNTRMTAFSVVLTIVSVVGVLVALAEFAGFGRGLVAAMLVVIVFGVPAGLWFARLAYEVNRELKSPRLQIAVQLAAMIGDVFMDIAQRENWSYFRIETVRLRLSAFPLDRRRSPAIRSVAPVADADETS